MEVLWVGVLARLDKEGDGAATPVDGAAGAGLGRGRDIITKEWTPGHEFHLNKAPDAKS